MTNCRTNRHGSGRPVTGPIATAIYIDICQDGVVVGFVDFTKLSFTLSLLAQPFAQMGSIPEYVFVILSQRKTQDVFRKKQPEKGQVQ